MAGRWASPPGCADNHPGHHRRDLRVLRTAAAEFGGRPQDQGQRPAEVQGRGVEDSGGRVSPRRFLAPPEKSKQEKS